MLLLIHQKLSFCILLMSYSEDFGRWPLLAAMATNPGASEWESTAKALLNADPACHRPWIMSQ